MHFALESSQHVFTTVNLREDVRTNFSPMARLGPQCSAIHLAIGTVVHVSMCLGTQTEEVSAVLERLPF